MSNEGHAVLYRIALVFRPSGRALLCRAEGEVVPCNFAAQSTQIHWSSIFSHPHSLTSCFNVFGSTCSIFLLQLGLSHSTKQYFPIVVTRLMVPFPSKVSYRGFEKRFFPI